MTVICTGCDGEWQSLFTQVKLLNDSHCRQVELGNDSPCVQMIGEWQLLCKIGAYILAWKHNHLPSPPPKWYFPSSNVTFFKLLSHPVFLSFLFGICLTLSLRICSYSSPFFLFLLYFPLFLFLFLYFIPQVTLADIFSLQGGGGVSNK